MSEPVTDVTPKKLGVFLAELMKRGIVTHAAKKARIAPKTAYRHKASDPDFSAAWDEAIDIAAGLLEAEAHRRAVTGSLEPVFYQGQKCGLVRKYSDTLLIFLLKAHKPERFKDNANVAITEPITIRVIREDDNGGASPEADNPAPAAEAD
jgi:hypothetical protein